MAKKTDLDILISSQQTELDAVLLYKKLAELTKSEAEKEIFLSMAADEGRHASILKGITGAQLTPNPALSKGTAAMYRFGGKKALIAVMSRFEIESFFSYKKFFTKYPDIAKIASDEVRHGHLLASML